MTHFILLRADHAHVIKIVETKKKVKFCLNCLAETNTSYVIE